MITTEKCPASVEGKEMISESRKCYNCDNDIYFNDEVKSVNGKSIPLDVDTDEPHQCKNKQTAYFTVEMRLKSVEERLAILESRL